ncbi:MAG: hypothetical protein ACI4WR_08850, partial [Bulleidia sp.]
KNIFCCLVMEKYYKKLIGVIVSLFACILTIVSINASELISEGSGKPAENTDYVIRAITGY